MTENSMGFDPSTFPNLTRETMLKERAKKETNDFQTTMMRTAALLPQKDRGMFLSAGGLGKGIAQAIAGKGTQLNAKEVQGLAIMENANKGMRKLQSSDEWGGMSQQERAFKTQDNLAKAALDAGDYQMFSLVSQQTARGRQDARKAKRELDKIDVGIDSTKLKDKKTRQEIKGLQQTFEARDKKVAGTYAVQTDGKYGFAGEPNAITGTINKKGQLVTLDGQTYDQYMALDTFDKFADNLRADNKPASTKAPKTPKEKFLSQIPNQEETAYRKEYFAANDQMGIVTQISEIFKEAMDNNVSVESIVGDAGTAINFFDKVGATIRGTTKAFVMGGTRKDDGTIEGGKKVKGIPDAVKVFGDDIGLPGSITKGSKQATRYKAAIMQAVYVNALSFESAAKSLTDNDIKAAMQRLGVDSGNPATVLRVMTEGVSERIGSLKFKMDTMDAIAQDNGMLPGGGNDAMFGKGAYEKIEGAYNILNSLTEETIKNVNADRGLTPPPAEVPLKAGSGPQAFGDSGATIEYLPN